MQYEEALKFILNKQSLGIMPGLERINKMLNEMGNPQNKLKIIHVAGTNGKGTVAATICRALINQGYKTGLFSSPWVIDYREQIQINNSFISKSELAFYINKYKNNDCSEFEFLTAIMYKYFYDSGVDYAVVECGMGGMGDATNVENKNISVITSVAIDHTAFLGDTIEKIAIEKSGIIKENSVCILYPNHQCESVFENKCIETSSKLIKVEETGNYKLNNLNTVKAVLNVLSVNDDVSLVSLPARQEIISNIMLDGAHNIDGAKALAKNFLKNDITAVIGMMKDKDVDGYLSIIAPKCKKIVTTSPDNPRTISADELKLHAEKYCSEVIAIGNPIEALNYAMSDKNFSLVSGSFYLARDIREYILHK